MSASRATLAGLLVVLLVPTALLARCLFGDRTFVPFDVARFAPIATSLAEDELAEVVRDSNTDPTEVVTTFIPELRFARQELEQGRLPQWNPYARFGAPLQATGVVGLDYPPNWLVLARSDPRDGLALGAWLSFAIAAGLMFGFLRSLGLSVLASVLGALVFGVSGTLVAQAHFYQRLAALVWLPGVLWSAHATVQARGWARGPRVAGLAVAVAMTWLSGFPQDGAPVLLVSAIWMVASLAAAARAHGTRAVVAGAAWLGVGCALGTALAAVQMLPMAAFFPESSRGGLPTADSLASQGLAPAGLLAWIMPSLFGWPMAVGEMPYDRSPLALWLLPRFGWDSGHPFPPIWNFTECTIFAGTLTLPLAAFAALRPRGANERGMLAAALALLALAGGYSWLGWLHELPGVRSVAPVRFAGPLCGPLAVLAALGFDRVWREARSDRCRGSAWTLLVLAAACACGGIAVARASPASFALGIADATVARFGAEVPSLTREAVAELTGGPDGTVASAARAAAEHNLLRAAVVLAACGVWFLLAGRGRRVAWQCAGVGLVAGELIVFAAPLLAGRTLPVPHDSPVHAFLRSERDRLAADGGYTVARATALPGHVLPMALPPCQLVPERIRDLVGYTFLDRWSHRVIERIWGPEQMHQHNAWPYAFPDDARLRHPYLDLIGVRWVLSEEALQHAGAAVGPQLTGTRLRADGAPVQFHVYERPDARPRAFVVPRLSTVPDDDAVIEALADPELDPAACAWVTAADVASAAPSDSDPAAAARRVTFERDDVQELVLRVADGPPGWLVLNDAWFSGWGATVGGASAPLVRANLSMRAVPVPAGAVEVAFRYTPPRFAAGAAVSAVALAITAALALAGLVRSRRRVSP